MENRGTDCEVVGWLWSLSPQPGMSSGRGRRDGLQLWRVAANARNKQPQTNDEGTSSSLRVGRGASDPSP
jgi:hypothetical protein